MDKLMLKEALVRVIKQDIEETEMKYEDFLQGNLLDKTDVIDDDDQSHHRQSIEISDQLDRQTHVQLKKLEAIEKISFEATDVVGPGAVVSVNGRCLIVAVSEPHFRFGGRDFLGISPQSPIYESLKGKRTGERFTFNGMDYSIEVVN